MNPRIETDAIGPIEVPQDSYGGSFMVRAMANFKISSLKAYPSFKKSFALVKQAAALVNKELGHLEAPVSEAIVQACEEFIEGKFVADYQLDAYQAGAGTPYNMNLNEILANRANEIMWKQDGGSENFVFGTYSPVHPNNHVNMAQSSNDTNPTALRMAALMDLSGLFRNGNQLLNSLEKKAQEFDSVLKVGRTHLQDAVPVTLGQEFGAYSSSLRGCLARIDAAQMELTALGIGGSATGSGINTHPEFSERMCTELSELSGLSLRPAENLFETTHSMAPFLAVSSSLRGLATELLRISNDLRLMASGPFAGLSDIVLPEVEPGSSIMPGKVNPSIAECMSMICIQVMGLDHAIALCAQQGQLELNWHTPLIMWDLLHQIEILTNGMEMFDRLCIQGIEANVERMKKTLGGSTALATALAPYMGYHEVAELVHESLEKGVPFVSLVPEEYKKYLGAEAMTKPNRV
jgi:aspartate ammonia-lyase